MNKIRIPKSWDDVTVDEFANLHPVLTMGGRALDRVKAIIAITSSLTVDEVHNQMTLAQYKEADAAMDFMRDWQSMNNVQARFKINGTRYSIDVNTLNSTGGQYMSTMELLKGCNDEDGGMDYGKLYSNLHLILASFITKDVKKWGRYKRGPFDPITFEQIADEIRFHMPISRAFPIGIFFCRFMETLTESMPDFLTLQEQKINEALSQVKKDLEKHGVGTSHLTT